MGSGQWRVPAVVDLTLMGLARRAIDKPAAFTVEGPNTQHVIYRIADNEIREIRSNLEALQVAGITLDGGVWHTIRRPDGWSGFGDVKAEAGNFPTRSLPSPAPESVSCTCAASPLTAAWAHDPSAGRVARVR